MARPFSPSFRRVGTQWMRRTPALGRQTHAISPYAYLALPRRQLRTSPSNRESRSCDSDHKRTPQFELQQRVPKIIPHAEHLSRASYVHGIILCSRCCYELFQTIASYAWLRVIETRALTHRSVHRGSELN